MTDITGFRSILGGIRDKLAAFVESQEGEIDQQDHDQRRSSTA